jgi:hypothetical protein
MIPERALPLIMTVVKNDELAKKLTGSCPENKFCDTSSSSRYLKLEIRDGIVPDNKL